MYKCKFEAFENSFLLKIIWYYIQVGEGQDVYFECLSQANPPVCWKTYFLISEIIKTRLSVDWQHLQVYKIQWLHDGYTVEGSTTGQVNHVHDTVDNKKHFHPHHHLHL